MNEKWHKGPPPSMGWWPASNSRDPDAIRWRGDGWWSVRVAREMSARQAAEWSQIRVWTDDPIEWQHRPANWPARSKT